jgi:hypothetical protein
LLVQPALGSARAQEPSKAPPEIELVFLKIESGGGYTCARSNIHYQGLSTT